MAFPADDDKQKRPARIKDVANAVGVSWKTVSNVVHGKPNVGTETRRRVQAAIEELGYRPDAAGRQLRQGRSNMLTLVVPEIDSPYFAALAHATIRAARAQGYAVFIEETGGDPELERDLARSVTVRVFDGMILSPLVASPETLLELQRIVPTVFLGEHIAGTQVDHLTYDNVSSVRDATAHLIAQGRRRIAFLGAQPGHPNHTGRYRLEGYRQALQNAGLAADRRLSIRATDYTREEGATRIAGLLQRRIDFDAVVCGNDMLAIGALSALRTAGRAVPTDVAVVGWDDIPEGRYSNPTLTTVAPDITGLAVSAVRMLVRRIENPGASPERHLVGHRLLVRQSSDPNHS